MVSISLNLAPKVMGSVREYSDVIKSDLFTKCKKTQYFSSKISDVLVEQLQIPKNQITIVPHQLQHLKQKTQTTQGQEMVKY